MIPFRVFVLAAYTALRALPAHGTPTLSGTAEVPSPIERVFIPVGFDDNDDVEVVLKGTYPNSCYSVGRTGATVDRAKGLITVWATSYEYRGGACTQLMTPFTQVVKLGFLPKGQYKVVYQTQTTVSGTLAVRPRLSESPDDYLYAPVEDVELSTGPEGDQSLILRGTYPHMFIGCMVLDKVQVKAYPDGVVVVQPIAAVKQEPEACGDGYDFTFKASVPLAEPLRGESLIHVRALHGAAVNRYVNLPR